MDDYVKGEVKELDDDIVSVKSPQQDRSIVHMRVNGGTKIRNVLNFAINSLKDPTVRQLTWNGSGQVITKVISCAEMMKRKIKGLYQVTSIKFKRVEEYWEPLKEGLERLKVNRDIPAISILLSKDPLDSTLPGYQAPDSCNILERPPPSNETTTATSQKQTHKQRWNRQRNNPATSSAPRGGGGSSNGASTTQNTSGANKRMRQAT